MENSDKIKRVVIAGGGTGGHIYPGIAIAQSLQKASPHIEVQFVGSPAGMESKIVPKSGFPLSLISVGKLNVPLLQKIKTLTMMPFSLFQSLLLLFRLRPSFVLGVGGYASGPFVMIASLCGVKTGLWEPNAFPGMANRILQKFVKRVFVVFPESAKYFSREDVTAVGLPVRAQMQAKPHEPLAGRHFRVLIFGGSQGARAINNVVRDALMTDRSWYGDIDFVHQVGNADFAGIESAYQKLGAIATNVSYFRYLDDMEARYAWADLVICRGGISTLSELAACQRASVIVPLPSAADNHQQKNAETLVNANAAKMILQKDFNPDSFRKIILEFKNHPEKIVEMEKNVRQFYRPNAAEEISKMIVGEL